MGDDRDGEGRDRDRDRDRERRAEAFDPEAFEWPADMPPELKAEAIIVARGLERLRVDPRPADGSGSVEGDERDGDGGGGDERDGEA